MHERSFGDFCPLLHRLPPFHPSFLGFALLQCYERYSHFLWTRESFGGAPTLLLAQAVAFGVFALVSFWRPWRNRTVLAVSGAAALGLVLILFVFASRGIYWVPVTVAWGTASALLFLPWFNALNRFSLRAAAVICFGSQLVSGVLGIPIGLIPVLHLRMALVSSFVLASVPLSAVALRHCPSKDEVSEPLAPQGLRGLWKYGAIFVLFGLSASSFNQMDLTSTVFGIGPFFSLWSAIASLAALSILVLCVRSRTAFNFQHLWREVAILALACVALSQSEFGQGWAYSIACLLIVVGRTTIMTIFSIAMVEAALLSGKSAFLTLSLGYALSVAAVSLPNALSAHVLEAPLLELPGFSLCSLAIIVTCVLLMPGRVAPKASAPGSSSLSRTAQNRAACQEISERFGLSPRETEVLFLLSEGETRNDTAHKLSLTPGTVATYTKRIYHKLDVQNKQGLLDVLHDVDPARQSPEAGAHGPVDQREGGAHLGCCCLSSVDRAQSSGSTRSISSRLL